MADKNTNNQVDVSSGSSSNNSSNRSGGSNKATVFKIMTLCLLMLAVVAVLNNGTVKSFGSLLDFLAKTPDIAVSWQIRPLQLDFPDWLSFLEVILEFISLGVSYIWTILLSAVQALLFVFNILRWIWS